MQTEEFEDLDECADCGSVLVEAEPVWTDTDGVALCFECALRRGGQYDAETESWTVYPVVRDLPDERRAHA